MKRMLGSDSTHDETVGRSGGPRLLLVFLGAVVLLGAGLPLGAGTETASAEGSCTAAVCIDGVSAVTTATDRDSLGTLRCLPGQVPVWREEIWRCGAAGGEETSPLGSLGQPLPPPDPTGLVPAECDSGDALQLLVDDALVPGIQAFYGEEAISRPSRHVVVLDSESALNPGLLVGESSRVEVTVGGSSSAFEGVVTEISLAAFDGGRYLYRLVLETPFSALGRSSDSRIFQDQSATGVVDTIFRNAGLAPPVLALGEFHPQRECVFQYNESDLDFVQRLLEEEGIHYHFSGSGALVFGDTNAAFSTSGATLSWARDLDPESTSPGQLMTFRDQLRLVPRLGTFGSYDFKNSTQTIRATVDATVGDGELYAYEPAIDAVSSAEAARRARLLIGVPHASRSLQGGTSATPAIRAGHTFTLSDSTSLGFSGDYVVTEARHMARVTSSCFGYANSFTAIPSGQTFRPARRTPVPRIPGMLSAVVTGPDGEQSHTDSHGRVKVQFHWDREGSKDESSSCWIRVAHPAVTSSTDSFLPEIGDEVLVGFLDGDPDRPVILGRLYNDQNTPPP